MKSEPKVKLFPLDLGDICLFLNQFAEKPSIKSMQRQCYS